MAKKKKGNTVSVNFKDVKVMKALPEGQYNLKIVAAEKGESKNDNETISWEFEVVGGKFEGSKLWFNSTLTEKSLWKLRELLEAAGLDVPNGDMDIDLDDIIGTEVGAIVFNEEYEGKNRAKISDFIPSSEIEDEDTDEDEKPSKKKAKNDEDDEEEETADVDSMDEDELKEFVEEQGLDIDLDDYSSLKKKRKAVAEALDNSSEDDEEETEKYSEDTINDMDTEELSKLNDDHNLGIEDLEDMKPKVARAAMLKALKKAKMLED